MKTVILCMVAISVLGLMLSVEARSPRVCEECDLDECEWASCPCGTVKDECNCCDLCRVCPRQPCSWMKGDVCQEGYVCGHAPGLSYVDKYNNPGTCVPPSETSSEDY